MNKWIVGAVAIGVLCACHKEEPEPAEGGVTITIENNGEWGGINEQ